MAITLMISKIKNKENINKIKVLTILIYSLSIIIVMYPISDEIHFLIGSTITIIGSTYLLYLIGNVIYNKIKLDKKKKIYKIITAIISSMLLFFILYKTVTNIYNYVNTEKNIEINHYRNIEITNNIKDRIKSIDEFILEEEKKENKVYILDSEAAVYMIPLDKYNKDYDMFLKGNIGKDAEQGQIEKIKQRDENTIYLIRNKKLELNWQSPAEVINYIRNNLQKTGEISMYEIYR